MHKVLFYLCYAVVSSLIYAVLLRIGVQSRLVIFILVFAPLFFATTWAIKRYEIKHNKYKCDCCGKRGHANKIVRKDAGDKASVIFVCDSCAKNEDFNNLS